MRSHGRTDGNKTKLTIAFHNSYANTPKNRNETLNPLKHSAATLGHDLIVTVIVHTRIPY